MSKTIVVFGAATGLGTRVARSYGAKGYDVVLVGRQAPPLQALASELGREGIYPRTFIGDLTIPEHAAALVRSIRHTLPSLDAIYYGPDQPQPYLPATAVALDTAQEWADLLFLSLVAVVNEVLPEMRARRAGAILVAQSRTADKGTPYLSGPGPAMAAARHYLQALEGEVAGEGIHIGLLNVGSILCHEEALPSSIESEIAHHLVDG